MRRGHYSSVPNLKECDMSTYGSDLQGAVEACTEVPGGVRRILEMIAEAIAQCEDTHPDSALAADLLALANRFGRESVRDIGE